MIIIILLYGLVIGSFLNVCIYRIPEGESIVFPPSRCPSCQANLKWYNLLPVISYLVQRGQCSSCGVRISIHYPLVELMNAALYLLVYIKYGFSLEFLFYALIFSLLLVVTMIDLKKMIIPDILIICILGTTIIYKLLMYIIYNESPHLLDSIGGLVLSALLFLLIILVSQGGMGGGDLTLIASLGFILGIKKIFLTIFLSFILGALISIFLLASKMKGRKDPIPFGPFIILGFFIVVFWGEQLLAWYMNIF